MTMKVKNSYFTKTHRCQFRYPIRGDLYVAGHPGKVISLSNVLFFWNENNI
jgi:hypothetical protein